LEGRQLPERGRAGECVTGQAGHWHVAVSIPCGDGKTRRIEPGLSPLVDGLPGRVGLLRGYGNAIVPQVAAAFVMAYMEVHR
jgi:DNA (cytosine-5)-methyltransferase 1